MATATAVPETEVTDAPEPKIRRKRLPMIIGGVALLAAIGGGVYWFLAHRNASTETPAEPEAVAHVELVPIYVPLENFTVNLQPEAGDQYLQVTMSLKVTDPVAVENLKTRMPEIRNRMLMLLSSKKASELSSTIGKERLGVEIQDAINHIFTPESTESNAASGTIAAAAAEPAKPEPAQAVASPVPTAAPAAPATTAVPAQAALPQTELGKQLAAIAPPAAATPVPAPTPAKPAEVLVPQLTTPVSGVLFTAFIIQ